MDKKHGSEALRKAILTSDISADTDLRMGAFQRTSKKFSSLPIDCLLTAKA